MKKIYWLLLLIILVNLCACSIPKSKPNEGIYYCDELKISIDFSVMENSSVCAKLYSDDGTYVECECLIDNGSGIFILSLDHETFYLKGNFEYKNDIVVVTTFDAKVFSFTRNVNE